MVEGDYIRAPARIAAGAAEHQRLRRVCAALGDVPRAQDENRHAAWAAAGRATAARSTLLGAERRLAAAERRLRRVRRDPRMLLARRAHAEARAGAAHAHADAAAARDALATAHRYEAELAEAGAALVRQRAAYDYAQSDLAAHAAGLFVCTDGLFPALDALRFEDAVLRETRTLVPIECEREQRARAALASAEREIRTVLRMLQQCLHIFIGLGLGENARHKTAVVTGGVGRAITRIEPIVLRMRRIIGGYYTYVALARQRQPEIARAAIIELEDLSRLLGRRKDAPPSEDIVVPAIESSYAQARGAVAFVECETDVSHTRERLLRRHDRRLVEEIAAVGRQIADEEGRVVDRVQEVHGEVKEVQEGVQAPPTAPTALTAPPPTPPPPGSATPTLTPSSLYTGTTVVDTHPDVRRGAFARLRQIMAAVIADARAESDDEDLPWTLAAMGI